MARKLKLKVYRMPVGFHDAYVAAPSQKAAAEAWGADASVFARGEAELVTDQALTAEPLASPGKVVKRLRGTAEEQLAALPAETPHPARKKAADKAHKPQPRPSRTALDETEAALANAEKKFAGEEKRLAAREAKLAEERRQLERRTADERAALETARAQADRRYQDALRRWRAEG